jgi:hypothetical protein
MMTFSTQKPTPKLRKAPQPPLSRSGATPDAHRARRPALSEAPATGQELNPGDRVEGLGNFGKPNGEVGTVKQTNEDDAVVKWDGDGRARVRQPSLKKI